MFKFALGMIETVGLAAAIEAADTAVKSANITLLGYELTRGGGLVTVKIAGDVGAVKAGVEAGSIAAAKVNRVFSKHVIPRPHDEIERLINNLDTVGNVKESKESKEDREDKEDKEIKEKIGKSADKDNKKKDKESNVTHIEEKKNEKLKKSTGIKKQKDICNICGDPECPRKKGEPRVLCIHNEK